MGQKITKEELSTLAWKNNIKSHFANPTFVRWILEVIEWDNNQQFMLENPFTDEIEYWLDLYEQEMTPEQAARHNWAEHA